MRLSSTSKTNIQIILTLFIIIGFCLYAITYSSKGVNNYGSTPTEVKKITLHDFQLNQVLAPDGTSRFAFQGKTSDDKIINGYIPASPPSIIKNDSITTTVYQEKPKFDDNPDHITYSDTDPRTQADH